MANSPIKQFAVGNGDSSFHLEERIEEQRFLAHRQDHPYLP